MSNPLLSPLDAEEELKRQLDLETAATADYAEVPVPPLDVTPVSFDVSETVAAEEPRVSAPPTPAELRRQQLIAAIGTGRQAKPPSVESDDRNRKAAQAFYAVTQRQALPASFFEKDKLPASDALAPERRDLLLAKTAKALAPDKTGVGADSSESLTAFEKLIDANNRLTPEQKAGIKDLAKTKGIREARIMFPAVQAGESSVASQGMRKEQFDKTMANKEAMQAYQKGIVARKLDTGDLVAASKAAEKAAQDSQKASDLLTTGDQLNRLMDGALEKPEIELSDDIKKGFGIAHKADVALAKLPGAVGKWALETMGLRKNKKPGEPLSKAEQEEAALISRKYGMEGFDPLVQTMYAKQRHLWAGSAVSAREEAFVDRAIGNQWGSSPGERVEALRIMLRGAASNLNQNWGNVYAMADELPKWKSIVSKLEKRPGVYTPNHPFVKSLTLGKEAPTVDEEEEAILQRILGEAPAEAPPEGEQGIVDAVAGAKRPTEVRIPPTMSTPRVQKPMPIKNEVQEPALPRPPPPGTVRTLKNKKTGEVKYLDADGKEL